MKRMIDDVYPRMPWAEIDAVVFDVGNVLLTFSPDEVLRRHFPGAPALQERLKEKIIHTPYWNMLDRGTLRVDQAVVEMAGRDEALRAPIRTFLETWPDFNRVIEEGVEALRLCKAKGKRLYVLSNYQGSVFDRVEREYDFFALFDGKVVSAREGMIKPHEDIYRLLAARHGITPARTLFIDDTAANIETALHLGWQGFCFSSPGKLRAFMG